MPFNVDFKPRAIKDLSALSKDNARRILEKITALQDDLQGDVKRLTEYRPEYRLRVGDYRVLFELEDKTIVIYRIIHRREAYR